MNIYDFKVKDGRGNDFPMSNFKGKVLLIVNTATGCGFTPQYKGLQELYDKYREQGFEILDFPCNQFAHQAPGTNEDIDNFCTLKYNTTFPRFAKIDVNGENEDPLFRFLKQEKGGFMKNTIIQKWQNAPIRFLQGVAVGLGGILPGISGGTLGAAFGIHQMLTECISQPKEKLLLYFRLDASKLNHHHLKQNQDLDYR